MCVFYVCFTSLVYIARYDRTSPEGLKAGTWLAGGFRGVLISIAGDMDYLCKTLGLPRWSVNTLCCSLCPCTKTGVLSYLDNRNPGAQWLRSIWKAANWKNWPDRSKCALFDLFWMSAANVSLDYMHCKYLGADQYLFGSVLHPLFLYFARVSPAEFGCDLEVDQRVLQEEQGQASL